MDTEKKEIKRINKLTLLIMAVVVLLLLVAGGGYYIYNQKQQMSEMTQAFVLEKESLEDEFNDLSLQYEGYKFSVGNDSLLSCCLQNRARFSVCLKSCVPLRLPMPAVSISLKKNWKHYAR